MPLVDPAYVIPKKVRQQDVQELVRYLKSMYSKIDAKEKVNKLESRGRLKKGVHDNMQALIDRMSESEFAEEIILIGGQSRRSKKRSSRKTRTKRKNAATRRR